MNLCLDLHAVSVHMCVYTDGVEMQRGEEGQSESLFVVGTAPRFSDEAPPTPPSQDPPLKQESEQPPPQAERVGPHLGRERAWRSEFYAPGPRGQGFWGPQIAGP